jgi:hypothetical protein
MEALTRINRDWRVALLHYVGLEAAEWVLEQYELEREMERQTPPSSQPTLTTWLISDGPVDTDEMQRFRTEAWSLDRSHDGPLAPRAT